MELPHDHPRHLPRRSPQPPRHDAYRYFYLFISWHSFSFFYLNNPLLIWNIQFLELEASPSLENSVLVDFIGVGIMSLALVGIALAFQFLENLYSLWLIRYFDFSKKFISLSRALGYAVGAGLLGFILGFEVGPGCLVPSFPFFSFFRFLFIEFCFV